MYRTARALRRALGAAFIICAATLAGCSGDGLFPDGGGPHSMPTAQLDRLVSIASSAHNLSPALVRAVITVESGGDPSAISGAGAMGLMQLMPGTARTYGVADAFEPSQNVDVHTCTICSGGTAAISRSHSPHTMPGPAPSINTAACLRLQRRNRTCEMSRRSIARQVRRPGPAGRPKKWPA
jgi:hypothetical protein